MTLGAEFRDLLAELIVDPDGFGSLLTWRHYTTTEDPTTGEQTQTAGSEVAFTGMLSDPVRTRLFSDTTLERASSVVVVPVAQLTTSPRMLDEVEVSPGTWLRVIELRELYGPGGTGSPVLLGYVAALGS